MKRILLASALLLMLLVLVNVAEATTWSGAYTPFYFYVDSTDLDQRDTTNLLTFTLPDRNTEIPGWAKLEGFMGLYYAAVDTGTTGAKVDTTKDTVAIDIMTRDADGTPWKVLQTLTFIPAGALTSATLESGFTAFGAGSYLNIQIPSDSGFFSNLRIRARAYCADSLNTKARLSAKITYGLKYWIRAR